MNKTELINCVADIKKVPNKEVREIIDAFLGAILRNMKIGEKISLSGFGLFRSRVMKPRTIRNPTSGVYENVPSKRKMVFKPSLATKSFLNS